MIVQHLVTRRVFFFFLQPMLSLTRMNSLANDSSRFSMGDLVNGYSS